MLSIPQREILNKSKLQSQFKQIDSRRESEIVNIKIS